MDNIKKIQKLLDDYIDESKKLRNTYEEKIALKDMYDELLLLLNGDYDEMNDNKLMISILFNSIYKNDIYETTFYHILNKLQIDKENKSEINKFIRVIKNDCRELEQAIEDIKNQIINRKYMLSSAYRVRLNFKQGTSISENKYDLSNIKKIINYWKLSGVITNKEELLLINEIELYNRRLMTKDSDNKREILYTNELYEKIPNILQAGFQEHDKILVDENRKDTLDKLVKQIINSIDGLNNEEIVDFIKGYKKYNISENEYNYIIVNIMDSYLSDLLAFYEILIDEDIYHDRKQRLLAIEDYYRILDKYLCLREYYEKNNENEIQEIVVEEVEQEIIQDDDKPKKEIIYSRSSVNPLKAFFIADMDDVPYEYYETVYDLIDKLKNNTLSVKESKSLVRSNNNEAGTMELLHDQVRIVYRHVKDNIYCVLGVFVKKANNRREIYNKLSARMIPDISTSDKLMREKELSEYNEKELENLVKNKSRKGTR